MEDEITQRVHLGEGTATRKARSLAERPGPKSRPEVGIRSHMIRHLTTTYRNLQSITTETMLVLTELLSVQGLDGPMTLNVGFNLNVYMCRPTGAQEVLVLRTEVVATDYAKWATTSRPRNEAEYLHTRRRVSFFSQGTQTGSHEGTETLRIDPRLRSVYPTEFHPDILLAYNLHGIAKGTKRYLNNGYVQVDAVVASGSSDGQTDEQCWADIFTSAQSPRSWQSFVCLSCSFDAPDALDCPRA
jgi:hypothetical protein